MVTVLITAGMIPGITDLHGDITAGTDLVFIHGIILGMILGIHPGTILAGMHHTIRVITRVTVAMAVDITAIIHTIREEMPVMHREVVTEDALPPIVIVIPEVHQPGLHALLMIPILQGLLLPDPAGMRLSALLVHLLPLAVLPVM